MQQELKKQEDVLGEALRRVQLDQPSQAEAA